MGSPLGPGGRGAWEDALIRFHTCTAAKRAIVLRTHVLGEASDSVAMFMGDNRASSGNAACFMLNSVSRVPGDHQDGSQL